jgi:hypothetical protein
MAFTVCFVCICVSVFYVERYVSAVTINASSLDDSGGVDMSKSIRFYKLFAQGFAIMALVAASI